MATKLILMVCEESHKTGAFYSKTENPGRFFIFSTLRVGKWQASHSSPLTPENPSFCTHKYGAVRPEIQSSICSGAEVRKTVPKTESPDEDALRRRVT